jgi:hypothetical protein
MYENDFLSSFVRKIEEKNRGEKKEAISQTLSA